MAKKTNTAPSMSESYLEALTAINDWTTVSDWALKVGEMFPEILEKANDEARKHKRPSTGIREIAARISSAVSTGRFAGQIEVDESERPKRVRVLSESEAANYEEREIESDLEPLTRAQRIKTDEDTLGTKEKYRIAELDAIIRQLKEFFNLDFELEHAKAILNPKDPGKHHPDNLQILLKSHNRQKSNDNWDRFTLQEQIEYIQAVVKVQKLVSAKMKIDLHDEVIESIIKKKPKKILLQK
ncbi:MAG: HNH endonuclease [Bdellovibrionia bacterium]